MDKLKEGVDKAKGSVSLDPELMAEIGPTVFETAVSYADAESTSDFVEDQAKGVIHDQVMDKIRPKLGGNVIKEKLADKAVEKSIDATWDEIKEKIQNKLKEKQEQLNRTEDQPTM